MTSPETTAEANASAPPNGVADGAAKPAPETKNGAETEPKPAAEAHSATATTAAKPEAETAAAAVTDNHDHDVNPLDFNGTVDTNHDLPTPETIRKVDNYVVLDKDGKSHTFRSLYTGKHAAKRMLVIFVRHFFCGSCHQYLRTLSASITPSALLALPQPTFICIIGCGDYPLIDMYVSETGCPFPVYADPTRRLYAELGMVTRTLAMGKKPAYMAEQSTASMVLGSWWTAMKQIPRGNGLKGGDVKQVGGEFFFEPINGSGGGKGKGGEAATPMEVVPPSVVAEATTEGDVTKKRTSETSLDGKAEDGAAEGEDKIVTWCHRMKHTRDHAEIPELMEVLGLDGTGKPVEDKERWERALKERKGTRLNLVGSVSEKKGATAV